MLKDLNSHWEKLVSSNGFHSFNRRFWKTNFENDKVFKLLGNMILESDNEQLFEIYNRNRACDPLDTSPKLFKKVLK